MNMYAFLPGIIISVLIFIFSSFLEKFIPGIGAASIAILLGIILGNTVFKEKKYEKGTKFCESKLLEYAIVLLGASVTADSILILGVKGVIYTITMMCITIFAAYFISKKLGFSKKFSLLMGAGNAVCGSSAIASASKVIDSEPSETGLSITIVNITGTIMMFLLPLFISPIFLQNDPLRSSALIGGTLQSVGQVVGGASMLGAEIVKFSTLFKILRILMLTFVLIFFSFFTNKTAHSHTLERKVQIKIPWYIFGFAIMCLLTSLGVFEKNSLGFFKVSGKFFELTALAAIGLRVKFETIKKEGPKSLLAGLSIGFLQIISALVLIFILF